MSSSGWNAATVIFGVIACAALAISIVCLLRKTTSKTSSTHYPVVPRGPGSGGTVARGPGVVVPDKPGTNPPIGPDKIPYILNDDNSITFPRTVYFSNGISGGAYNQTTPLLVNSDVTASNLTATGNIVGQNIAAVEQLTADTGIVNDSLTVNGALGATTVKATSLTSSAAYITTVYLNNINTPTGSNNIDVNANLNIRNHTLTASGITSFGNITANGSCCK